MTEQILPELRVSWREGGDHRAPALVLLHAFPVSGALWQAQIEAFSSRFRVLCPDARGLGDTSPFDGKPSIEQLARDVAAWLDYLQVERLIMGGCSMGGYTALEFVRLFPKRVRGLLLCDTRADADSPETKQARDEMSAFARQNDGLAVAEKMVPRLLSSTTRAEQPNVADAVREMARPLSGENAARLIEALRDRRDQTPLLSMISVPTLCIGGRDDAVSPPAVMEQMARAIVGAQHVVIEGAGHLASLEAPRAWNEAVGRWLQDAEPE